MKSKFATKYQDRIQDIKASDETRLKNIKMYEETGSLYNFKEESSENKIENTNIFTNNKLFAFKEKLKWGFKNKEGNTIVEPKFELVTEFNDYGFAGIKQNDKIGDMIVTVEIQIPQDLSVEEIDLYKKLQELRGGKRVF